MLLDVVKANRQEVAAPIYLSRQEIEPEMAPVDGVYR